MAFMVCGCTALLPTVRQTTPSPWRTFDDAKQAFDRIIPYQTTTEDLKRMGLDPFSTPNVRIINYLDIAMDIPAVKKEELAQGIQDCIRANSSCHAYEFEPKQIRNKRHGNFWLDFFNFKRNIRESGWRFKILVILVDNTVVYKLWGGNPLVDEEREEVNPLGPLQNSGDGFIKRLL